MKKSILYLAFVLPIISFAQNYAGYNTDNYNGVHGVIFNPANIVDSNFRSDINVISTSVLFDNDYISVDLKDVIKTGELNYDTNATKHPSLNNTFNSQTDILGPSFMMNLKPKHSIAIYTRLRSSNSINGINGELYERVDTNFNATNDWNITDDGFNATQHTWGELGFSYATILVDKEEHFLKGGITLKYLKGLANSFVKTDNIVIDYNASATGAEIDSQGTLTYATSLDDTSGDIDFNSGANGLGSDLGFIYEWRPTTKDSSANKYKLKFGLAITDIGSITYKATEHVKYTLNGTSIDENTFDNNDFEDALQILADAGVYSKNDLGTKLKVNLPTALHLNGDWNISNKWYVNFNSDISLTGKNKQNTNTIISKHTLTPRFETKWFTAQMPITRTALQNTFVGFGFRVGPFYAGSSSVISNFTSKKSRAIDVYVGLKIPIYKK